MGWWFGATVVGPMFTFTWVMITYVDTHVLKRFECSNVASEWLCPWVYGLPCTRVTRKLDKLFCPEVFEVLTGQSFNPMASDQCV